MPGTSSDAWTRGQDRLLGIKAAFLVTPATDPETKSAGLGIVVLINRIIFEYRTALCWYGKYGTEAE
jgi:hypothetical protein